MDEMELFKVVLKKDGIAKIEINGEFTGIVSAEEIEDLMGEEFQANLVPIINKMVEIIMERCREDEEGIEGSEEGDIYENYICPQCGRSHELCICGDVEEGGEE